MAEEKERIAKALRERLDEHDENRKIIQDEIASTCDRFAKEAEELEGKLSRELEQEFAKETNRLQSTLSDLTKNAESQEAVQKANEELSKIWSCLVVKEGHNTCSLKIKIENTTLYDGTQDEVIRAIEKRLEEIDEVRRDTQEKIQKACNEKTEHVEKTKQRLNAELKDKYTKENDRL